jgi:hypothetical protein
MRFALLVVVVALVTACVYLDYTILIEYYGDGPPYYGRSVNMDKWQNPLPFLAVINAFVVAVVGLIWKASQKKAKGDEVKAPELVRHQTPNRKRRAKRAAR